VAKGSRIIRYARAIAAVCLLTHWASAVAELPVRIFAAASLTEALSAVAVDWHERGHPLPQLVFGGTAILARQVKAGAPVDVFAAADARWMDELTRDRRLLPGTRVDLLGNSLVLVAPKGRSFAVALEPRFDFARALKGKLCMGEPGVVPVGTYGRQVLQNLGWWESLQGRIVGTEDVRSALAFVARGECAAGIVYATDAAASKQIDVIARIPVALHSAIVYPFAVVQGAAPAATDFLAYARSEAAAAIFRRHGFVTLAAGR
jgi:molybdate transport system substrate-binding protein